MQISTPTQTGLRTSFTLSSSHVTYANTLRRLILTGVETVAFRADMTSTGTTTDVIVKRNDTPMTNEMLADRIGLLPIHVQEPLKWKNEYVFELEVLGSDNKTTYVSSGDFRIKTRAEIASQTAAEEEKSQSATAFFPPNSITGDTCLIATLQPGTGDRKQGIHIIATASIGTGREHARFSPVSQCTYEYTPDTDEQRRQTMFREWCASAKKVNAVDRDSERVQELWREFNTMQVKRCFKVNDRGDPDSFDFVIETIGVLSVPYIVDRACAVGELMCNQYANIHMGDLPEGVTIKTADSRMIGYDFLFEKQDHTLGNLFQTWMEQNLMADGASPQITYVGYCVPHPLRDVMVLRVGVADRLEDTARQAIAAAARGCGTIFKELRAEWNRTTDPRMARPAHRSAPRVASRKAK